MRFRKSLRSSTTARSSPKMELLRRPTSSGRMSGFKRSKSFRASVKLIAKIKSHANLHTAPSYDLSSKFYDNTQERINNLSSVSEDQSNNIAKELESKLNLEETSSNAAYENPTFIDSSLDSSVSSFFHEDSFNQSQELEKDEEQVQRRRSLQSNGLTVIVESGEDCRTHNWCTRVEDVENRKFVARTSSTSSIECAREAKPKTLRPRTIENITNFLSGARSGGFRDKGVKRE